MDSWEPLNKSATYGLSVLAEAAFSVPDLLEEPEVFQVEPVFSAWVRDPKFPREPRSISSP